MLTDFDMEHDDQHARDHQGKCGAGILVFQWPRPHSAPIKEEANRPRRSVAIVETAAR